jgi:hypothetical protein
MFCEFGIREIHTWDVTWEGVDHSVLERGWLLPKDQGENKGWEMIQRFGRKHRCNHKKWTLGEDKKSLRWFKGSALESNHLLHLSTKL